MTRISHPAILLSLALALVIVLVPAPASACPSCYNHSQWNPNCAVGGCNYCAFCSYCCGRFGIGCEYCIADAPGASTGLTASTDGDCADATASADPLERLFGAGVPEPQVTAPAE